MSRLAQFRETQVINPGLGIAPIIIAAAISSSVSVVTRLISSWKDNQRDKVATTNIVNEVEPYLQHNLEAYFEGNRSTADQQQALANFDGLWSQVVQACNNPAFGDPGRRCISERQRGGKWDWFSYYRDPITNDPEVKQVNAIASTLFGGNATSETLGSGYALGAGLALVGLGIFMLMRQE